jgi:hypothetical protein
MSHNGKLFYVISLITSKSFIKFGNQEYHVCEFWIGHCGKSNKVQIPGANMWVSANPQLKVCSCLHQSNTKATSHLILCSLRHRPHAILFIVAPSSRRAWPKRHASCRRAICSICAESPPCRKHWICYFRAPPSLLEHASSSSQVATPRNFSGALHQAVFLCR